MACLHRVASLVCLLAVLPGVGAATPGVNVCLVAAGSGAAMAGRDAGEGKGEEGEGEGKAAARATSLDVTEPFEDETGEQPAAEASMEPPTGLKGEAATDQVEDGVRKESTSQSALLEEKADKADVIDAVATSNSAIEADADGSSFNVNQVLVGILALLANTDVKQTGKEIGITQQEMAKYENAVNDFEHTDFTGFDAEKVGKMIKKVIPEGSRTQAEEALKELKKSPAPKKSNRKPAFVTKPMVPGKFVHF